MNTFSLRTLIDDILLIVRNNNISESEDLSRAQIASWIMHYRALLIKQKQQENAFDDSWFDECLVKTVGPIKTSSDDEREANDVFVKNIQIEIGDLLFDDPNNIISVTNQDGCPIQRMHSIRRHFHYFRKYTPNEFAWDWKDGKILIQGHVEFDKFEYIWVKYISSGTEDSDSEDDINIPGWMVPVIKENILKTELSFMIKMPSDDDNNSTLDGIKPNGPQDQEK